MFQFKIYWNTKVWDNYFVSEWLNTKKTALRLDSLLLISCFWTQTEEFSASKYVNSNIIWDFQASVQTYLFKQLYWQQHDTVSLSVHPHWI